jgi:hypothetical protein
MNCSVTDGDPPFIYNWYTQFPGDTSFTQSTADSGNTSFTMQPFNDYNILVKVTDNQGCVSTDTVHLVVKPNPVISLGPDQRVCKGIPVMLDAGDNNGNGAAGYLWSTGATTRTISVTDSNTYYCKIIDSTGCFKMDTVDVFVNDIPPVYAGPDVNGCPNDTFYIPASGAQSYTWYDLSTGNVISTDTILPFYGPKGTTATYVLQGDMTIGGVTCTSYDTVSAVIADLPTLVFPQLRRCEDWPQINLYVQDAYYMINGTKVADQGSATFSSATNPSSISGSILYPPIAGGTSATNPNMVVVNYTTQYGCTIIDSFQVLIDPLPATDIDIRNFCEADADFKLTGSGYPQGAGTVNETWSGAGVYLNGSDYYFSPATAGTGAFLVTYEFKTNQGCKKSDTATYFVRPIPHITYTDPADICSVDGPQNLFNMTGAQPNYGTWQWVSAPSGSLDGTTGDYIPTVAGTYKFAYVVAAGSCKDSINITLNVNPTPTVTMPAAGTFCITDPPVALTISNPGNTTGYWEIDGDSVKGVSSTFDPSIGAGIHYCTYVYYDILTGCKNRDSVTMSVTPQPTVSITPSAPICQGDSIPLVSTFQNAQGIQWTTTTGGRFTNDVDTNAWYIPSTTDITAGTVMLTLTTTGNGYCQAATTSFAYTINPDTYSRLHH